MPTLPKKGQWRTSNVQQLAALHHVRDDVLLRGGEADPRPQGHRGLGHTHRRALVKTLLEYYHTTVFVSPKKILPFSCSGDQNQQTPSHLIRAAEGCGGWLGQRIIGQNTTPKKTQNTPYNTFWQNWTKILLLFITISFS